MDKLGQEIIKFLLDNHMIIISGFIVLAVIRNVFIGEKIESEIGKPINLNADISMIYPDGKGGHTRVFKEDL